MKREKLVDDNHTLQGIGHAHKPAGQEEGIMLRHGKWRMDKEAEQDVE
jgi:hypothetical protein